MPTGELDRVQRTLLLHLLEHHGQQVRFEASQWVTEFGIVRRFADEPAESLRRALRVLEMARLVYRRTQYVVGYSEPKHVYALTPSGHRKALEVRADDPSGDAAPAEASLASGRARRSVGLSPEEPPPTDGSAEPTV